MAIIQPRRNDPVARWLKYQRDLNRDPRSIPPGSDVDDTTIERMACWTLLDNMLDTYRELADTGRSLEDYLGEEFYEDTKERFGKS